MVKQTLKKELEGIRFIDFLGEPSFIYEEFCEDGSKYVLRETIPKKVLHKGEQAVMKYAVQKLREAKKKWNEFEDAKDTIRKNPILVRTEYADGTLLEGRIIEATSRYVKVELDKPLKGERNMNFGYASAMVGQYVFAKGNKLSKHAYDVAYECLCNAYEEALRKPEKDLMNRLNRKLGN